MPKDDEVLVRVHATTVTRTDCGWREPPSLLLARLHRPAAAEVQDARDGVRRRGRGGRFGRHGLRAREQGLRRQELRCERRVRLRPRQPRPGSHARRPSLRGGGSRRRRRLHRAGVPSPRGRPRGAEHRRVRRLRLHRHRCRPARKAFRRARHGRVQREEHRPRPFARRRRGNRLRARELHEQRADVRRRLRLGGQALVPALAALAEGRVARSSRPTSGSCGTCRCSRSRADGSGASG